MPPAERRTVAVLFSDLSGFTALSESMDPEDVRDLVDELFARFRRAIESRGGTVDKFIGDAVMAVFGAPTAHEDDALRAVRAALAMQREIHAFSAERGVALRLRVGVNVGEVLWGGIGGDRATAMGDAVNVAQRLESAARPGTILVSEAVRKAAGTRARFQPAGEFALKGRKESVLAHEAIPEDAGSAESAIIEGVGGAIFGREPDLARLETAWKAGSSRVLVLEGEAGIGKSRLVAELRRRVRSAGDGAAIFTGRALQEAPLSLAPFAEIARQAAGAAGEDAGSQVAAWFAGAIGEGPVAGRQADLIALSLGFGLPEHRRSGLDAQATREETLPAWQSWFRALTAVRRVLLCVEDLHWAGAATCDLAAALAAAAPEGRALVLTTTRPSAKNLPGDVVRLGELGPEAVKAVAQAVLRAPVSDTLADFILRQSGGNPYFAEELARHLRSHALLAGRPLELVASPERVPETLLGVLVARIDAQSPATREGLKAASVLGRVFWPGLLPPGLAPALEEARDAGLVLPAPASVLPGEPALQFRHALLRDAAYGLLTKRDRASLHRTAAEALESRSVLAGRAALTLAAGHREQAGEPAEAVRLHQQVAIAAAMENPPESLAAALESMRLQDSARSRHLLGHAYFLLGRLGEAGLEADAALAMGGIEPLDRAHAAMLRANIDLLAGHFERALDTATSGILPALGPKWDLNRRGLRCRALAGLGRPLEALQETEDLRTDAPASRELELARAFLLGERGATLLRLARIEEALDAHRRTREIHIGLGNSLGVSSSANNIATLLFRMGRTEEALQGFGEALSSARQLGVRHGITISLANLGAVLGKLGRWTEAEAVLREALAIRMAMGAFLGSGTIPLNLSRSLRMQGRLAEAAAVLVDGCERARGLQDPMPWLRLVVSLISLEEDRGEPRGDILVAEARLTMDSHPGFAAEPVGRELGAALQFHEARIAARRGQREEALRKYAEAIKGFELADDFDYATSARLRMVELGVPDAQSLAASARAEAHRLGRKVLEARALALLAGFAAEAGNRGEAETLLRESEAVSGSVSEPVERLKAAGAQAAAREALGDSAGAATARESARALAEKMGALGLLP